MAKPNPLSMAAQVAGRLEGPRRSHRPPHPTGRLAAEPAPAEDHPRGQAVFGLLRRAATTRSDQAGGTGSGDPDPGAVAPSRGCLDGRERRRGRGGSGATTGSEGGTILDHPSGNRLAEAWSTKCPSETRPTPARPVQCRGGLSFCSQAARSTSSTTSQVSARSRQSTMLAAWQNSTLAASAAASP